ncbi:MAG: hypothetical protein HC905_14040 [Bacteroidales bacterium]|nr:hypothetical protein [Bacteroidales bacterium]
MLKQAKYLLIIFTLILSYIQLSGQTFPLKISENGKYLITKKGPLLFECNNLPFTIRNARKNNLSLNRFGNYGFNAIVPDVHFPEPNNNKD